MIASRTRNCSGAGVVNAGRIRAANSASIVASIVSVLASLPIARAKSRTCLGLTTAMGNFASVKARSRGCSSPPVLSHVMSVGLHFFAYFRNFLIPTGLFSNSRTSPDSRLNTSSLGLLMSTPIQTSLRMIFSLRLGFPTSSFLAKRTRGSCSRSDSIGTWVSTTILLSVDLVDQGAFRSAVLGPILNLQGAVLRARRSR